MGEEYSTTAAPVPWYQQDWAQKLPETIERGAEHLLSLQLSDGYWKGELEADSGAGPHRQARQLCPRETTGRWRLEHLSERSVRAERDLQSLCRIKTGWR